MTKPFWKPQPREPWSDWRMYSMLVPILVSALGFFVTGIFAFAFSDIAVIPSVVQSWMVIIGSGLIVFGAELNTPFTAIEVFRKILRKEANSWDVSALVVSLVGTMANLLVTFASRLSLAVAWKAFVLNWGPLLAGFAVACDYYGAMVELGFLFGSFELRMETWLEEKRAWEQENGKEIPANLPPARMADFERVLARLNGQRSALNVEQLESELAEDGVGLPSKSTVKRWLGMARG
jgi:hypothetical protein